MLWQESAGYGVGVIVCGQTWAERVEIGALNRMTFDENTAEMAELLATDATPTPPVPRVGSMTMVGGVGWHSWRVGAS